MRVDHWAGVVVSFGDTVGVSGRFLCGRLDGSREGGAASTATEEVEKGE